MKEFDDAGREVYGLIGFDRDGAAAEYALALPSELAAKPKSLEHERAAAVPFISSNGIASFVSVQLASWAGAEVVGLVSAKIVDFIKSLGGESVIDYTATPLGRMEEKFDVVVGCQMDKAYPGSRVKIKGFIVKPDKKQLGSISALLDEESLRPVVAATMPLAEVGQAFEIGALGHTKGKIVFKVDG
ncbi:MAG: hypothetical protein M1835_002025 [Candelina submexicana]|nr:MAG: hypothetical protein M1835_002025 [Candelina submexicana]